MSRYHSATVPQAPDYNMHSNGTVDTTIRTSYETTSAFNYATGAVDTMNQTPYETAPAFMHLYDGPLQPSYNARAKYFAEPKMVAKSHYPNYTVNDTYPITESPSVPSTASSLSLETPATSPGTVANGTIYQNNDFFRNMVKAPGADHPSQGGFVFPDPQYWMQPASCPTPLINAEAFRLAAAAGHKFVPRPITPEGRKLTRATKTKTTTKRSSKPYSRKNGRGAAPEPTLKTPGPETASFYESLQHLPALYTEPTAADSSAELTNFAAAPVHFADQTFVNGGFSPSPAAQEALSGAGPAVMGAVPENPVGEAPVLFWRCNQCAMNIQINERSIADHIEFHHDTRRSWNNQDVYCLVDSCQQRTKIGCLKRHIVETHFRLKTQNCEKCNKAFSRSDAAKRHLEKGSCRATRT